ncbi:hypothetical protein K493DRAFT_300356 [Basidiobolus meristosporus CBS 931.73]|uniref:Uncharacterized protein n=1 Tax=Basidiobolus meristosporus CBS 931.73 TaxID=1314790 RepID=A0A1Y1YI38_9FUNG|nr:hypothetical protein K493DRAFT_300356 [Basidiobolus meristosporus CBS 931.73]|eukprot:ORX97635.1 hypothetical protein K493DRAFT_300356 [Basidiobolus meristosporus CBS 931.73]
MAYSRLLLTPLFTVSTASVGTLSAIAYFYGRALGRIHSLASGPNWSLINTSKRFQAPDSAPQNHPQYYRDTFQLRMPASRLSITKGLDPDSLLVHYARAFYTSPIFKLERLILRFSPPSFLRSSVSPGNHGTDQTILKKSFQIGDTVAFNVFTVANRDSKQLELHFTLDSEC